MNAMTKWAFRVGLAAGLCAVIGSLCLGILDLVAPSGSGGNREAPESLVGILFVSFILLGFIVFVGAVGKLREIWGPLSQRTRWLLMGILVATNFFGGYVFFMIYPRLHNRTS
jgi:hypothetical protein